MATTGSTQAYSNNHRVDDNIAVPKTTVLDEIGSNMVNSLNSQSRLINQIEEKLHRILDKTVSAGKPDPQVESNPPDFVSKLRVEVYRIDEYNARLEQIVSHLSDII